MLNQYLESPLGQRLLVAADIDTALEAGFHIRLDDVSYLEFRFLKILREERKRWECEEVERNTKSVEKGNRGR